MKSKKHILLLVPGFPAGSDDTTCIPPLQALVRELQEQYGETLHLQVVAFQYPFYHGHYTWNGVNVWSAGGRNKRFPQRFFTWLRIFYFIFRLHRKNHVSIIHSFWLHECAFMGKWIAIYTRSHHIAHVMGQDVLKPNKYFRYLDPANMTVIANSIFSAKQLEMNFACKADKIIPFGINEVEFLNFENNSERPVDLLNVGSLIPLKNQELFIALFADLRKIFPAIKGAIIGEGPMEQRLAEQIILLGLENSLSLLGRLSRDQVLKSMARSKILLHTSLFESAGYVLVEALASGMKVISFKTGFLPEAEGAYACESEDEMFDLLKKLLQSKLEFHKNVVPTIKETAEKIYEVYMDAD